MRLLDTYSAEQVEDGVARVVSEYEYKTLPPFAVLKKAMDKAAGTVPPETALDMLAESEWNALLDAVGSRGRYNPPTFHPTTAYVLRGMGGWDAACTWPADKLDWRHKSFIDAWKLAHGNTEVMALGAKGLETMISQAEDFTSAGVLVNRVLGIAANAGREAQV